MILKPLMNKIRNESDSVQFHCDGNGIPTPDVIWMKDGRKLNKSDDIKDVDGLYNFRESTLTLQDLKYDDRGNYSCIFKNRIDKDVKTAVLVVHGK